MKQDMIKGFPSHFGSFNENLQILNDLLLARKFQYLPRTYTVLELLLSITEPILFWS
jgi:hypothetical protein